MRKNTEAWRFGWQTCPGCGSYDITDALVCPPCRLWLASKARAGFDIRSDWSHRFLFDWSPGEDSVLSNTILALKGRVEKRAWDYWANEFLYRHRDRIFSLRDRVICAAPAGHVDDDHASLFARALASRLGLPYGGRPLLKTGLASSRGLSRRDRLSREDFVKSTGFTPTPESKIILVDDVLTTGATALAVKQALKSPLGFEVWTLAARVRVSCGVSEPMIGI